MLATSLTIGIGGSGGVFAPSLFIGAMLGSAYGIGVHHLLPHSAGAVGAYALVGMGAVFAGAARAPITAVVILFELTGEYSIILPLMLAIVLATATSRLLSRDTIYTLKLRRRGIDLDGPAPGARLGAQQVGAVMEPLPSPLAASTNARATPPTCSACPATAPSPWSTTPAATSASSPPRRWPRRSRNSRRTHRRWSDSSPNRQPPSPRTSRSPRPCTRLLSVAGTGLPVLDAEHGKPVGWLSHQSALRAVHAVHAAA